MLLLYTVGMDAHLSSESGFSGSAAFLSHRTVAVNGRAPQDLKITLMQIENWLRSGSL